MVLKYLPITLIKMVGNPFNYSFSVFSLEFFLNYRTLMSRMLTTKRPKLSDLKIPPVKSGGYLKKIRLNMYFNVDMVSIICISASDWNGNHLNQFQGWSWLFGGFHWILKRYRLRGVGCIYSKNAVKGAAIALSSVLGRSWSFLQSLIKQGITRLQSRNRMNVWIVTTAKFFARNSLSGRRRTVNIGMAWPG